MVAYIFRAENTVTKKTYIGKNLSVKFDKHYVGEDPGVLSDVQNYGNDKFIINMIKACETVKECDMAYAEIVKELGADKDENYYNCKPEQAEAEKKSRKKKADAE